MTFEVDEQVPATYRTILVDESNAPVDGALIDTLTLTLYDQATGAIINSRDAQDVLNAHDVTIDDVGLLTWNVRIEDNQIVNDAPTVLVTNADGDRVEIHKALFRATWDAGTKAANKLVTLSVRDFDKLAIQVG